MYAIKCTSGRFAGKYVNVPGLKCSYTSRIQCARAYPTKEAADRERCPENEIVVEIRQELAATMW